MRFLCFRVLPGNAEALLTGEVKNHNLTACYQRNILSKNYQNRLMYVEVIASQSSDVFWGHSVHILIPVTCILPATNGIAPTMAKQCLTGSDCFHISSQLGTLH